MLLSIGHDAKTIKGQKKGYLTGILYLAPSDTSGFNVCARATDGCKQGCLNKAGRAAIYPMIERARIRKTRELFSNRAAFVAQLHKDIETLVRKAKRENMIPCVRLNGTSDIPWLALTLAKDFPDVQFYDYTKLPLCWARTRPNYHLTFSYSENNAFECIEALEHGINVAVVFDTKKNRTLPSTWQGYKVTDGDISDLRFLDEPGIIIGLRAKGPAKHDYTGFVIKLTQIGAA